MRPVGQVVKTEASHAFNIGSNPVRVTTSKQAAYRSLPTEAESLLIPLLLLAVRNRFAGLLTGEKSA